jgi:hypothetical protein
MLDSRMFLPALALAILSSQAAPPATADAPAAAKGRTHLLVADAVRVDLRRRALFVQTTDSPPAELRIGVEEGKTRVSSGGKTVRLEDVRPGDRVAISCSDDAAGAHTARLIVIRPRAGSGTPAPRPAPTAPPKG